MIYLIYFVLLFIVELTYFQIAKQFNIIDNPNQRSSHTRITLRGGGVIFYFGILIYFILEGFQFPWFFLGLSLISAISFADDLKPQSSKLRLIIHFVAMICLFYQWDLFQLPWYYTFLSLILCIGILNAYNFMDGINGITGGYSLVIVGAFWYINSYQISFIDNQFVYLLILSLLVFNFFNFRKKAKCFAGDVGSISIAFILIFILGKLVIKISDFSYLIFFVVYGVDSILTIIHRIILKENIFEPHRKHLFQLMANELKISHLLVTSIYMLLQAIIIIGFLFVTSKYLYLLAVIFVLSIIYISIKRRYYHLHECISK